MAGLRQETEMWVSLHHCSCSLTDMKANLLTWGFTSSYVPATVQLQSVNHRCGPMVTPKKYLTLSGSLI